MRQNKNKCRMTMDIKKYEMLAQVIENSMTKEIRDQSV